jgi:hypothetical protein
LILLIFKLKIISQKFHQFIINFIIFNNNLKSFTDIYLK